jgi:choline-sulfatase
LRWPLLALLGILSLAIGAAGSPAAPPPRPVEAGFGPLSAVPPGGLAGRNVLLVTLDTTRADRLGCYGARGAETAALDRIAAEGIRFTQAAAAAPETLPSHVTLLTGLYPPGHGVRMNSEFRLGAGPRTLAELFRAKRYETAAFVSAFVLDARYGLGRGFDLYDDRVSAPPAGAFPSGTVERPAAAVTDAALDWLSRRRGTKPFFAWVHYFDAHAPYLPPEPWAARFSGRLYEGEIAYVDSQLARLIGALRERRLLEETLVVVTADHGESLGEHAEKTHGLFLYDATMRVPLLVRLPGAPARGAVDGRQVSLVDMLPTLAALCGLDDRAPRDGVSLLGPVPKDRTVYLESLTPFLDFGWAPLSAVRSVDAKYIRAPRPEMYDLAADPSETRDLARAPGSATRRMAALAGDLAARLASGPPLPGPGGGPSRVSAEELRALQSLGYLAGAGPGPPADLPDPKDMAEVASWLADASALLASGRPEDALDIVRRAAARSPRDRSVLQSLGKISLRLGRLKDAEAAFRAFTAIWPKADVSLLLAQILILRSEDAEAGHVLDEAARLEPEHGGIFIARGDLAARRGRRGEAAALYEKARLVDPYRAAGIAASRLQALQTGGPGPGE